MRWTSLRCEECGAVAHEAARGWRAVRVPLVDDMEEVEAHGPRELVAYCPECARREFGEPRDE